MCPTIGKPNVRANAVWCDQPVVSGIAVDLQDTGEALQYSFGMEPTPTRSIGEGDTWGSASVPRTIIPRQRPKVSGLGLARAGIKYRSTGLVHEQLGRALQVGNQRIEDGTQLERCPADPIGKSRAVEIDALAAHDLGLSIKRKVIGIFGDQHMGDGCFRRQACLDKPCWSRGLDDAISAGTAPIFGAAGDNDAELRWNHVQPLGDILANAVETSAADTNQALRLDYLFNTRQMRWKGAAVERAWLGNPVSGRNVGLILGMDGSHGRLQVFQGQVELVWIDLLGFAPEGGLFECGDQLLKPFDPLVLASDLDNLIRFA